MNLSAILKLIRPKDWSKNLFIFIPVFFAGKVKFLFTDYHLIAAFVAFSLAASFIYILNDILDSEKDKLHPKKKFRPIAAGTISKNNAIALATLLLISTLSISIYFGTSFYLIIGYIVLNIGYIFYLKHIAIIDISCISLGFVLRVITGGLVVDVLVSKWLILIVFLLSMCLALGKRRDEVIIYNNGEKEIRPSLKGYNLEFLNLSIAIMLVITVMCYIMYCVSADVVERLHSNNIYLTTFFVLLGLLRFLQISIVKQNSGSPTDILMKDRFIQLVLIAWILTFAAIIYF